MIFEWDEKKNRMNIKKHSVSFEQAKVLFYSENSVVFDDPDHSDVEERFLIVGFNESAKALLCCFCEREHGRVIRIISARKLTKLETKLFMRGDFL